MKTITIILFSLIVQLISESNIDFEDTENTESVEFVLDVKAKAFKVLDAKCNVCHKRQNPFKIFSLKNMEKHAPKIYKQVFIKKRMPKGNEIKLTNQEYKELKNWLNTLKIK